jgi:hypothetical protein
MSPSPRIGSQECEQDHKTTADGPQDLMTGSRKQKAEMKGGGRSLELVRDLEADEVLRITA